MSTTVISPDGQYLAQVTGSKVSIYSAIPLDDGSRFIGSITLKEPLASQLKVIRISSRKGTHDSRYQKKISVSSSLPRRILCAGESRVSVYDLESGNWVADVDNPGGTCVEFGANESEVLILNAWMTKASIADVDTGRIMVIKSPKACSPQAQGHGYRPRTGQFAILLKPEATDLLTIHEPSSYDVINKVSLPTVDAQGLKWSPDGRWLAVWDTASSGTRVSIYTADGQFLRTYTGPKDLDNTHDLGVRAVEWAPADKDQKTPYLIVGKNDGTADVVNARTVSFPKEGLIMFFLTRCSFPARPCYHIHSTPLQAPRRFGASKHPLPMERRNMQRLQRLIQLRTPPDCPAVCPFSNSRMMAASWGR